MRRAKTWKKTVQNLLLLRNIQVDNVGYLLGRDARNWRAHLRWAASNLVKAAHHDPRRRT
jgi:hypothetical protein